ncbi:MULTISPECIES: glycerol-3-phosphate 1-O-acyltransferase PlsB [Acinetobacter]|uniref:Glycerol-3-phosphate acyltransferase n=2 Tax=Acinetobacter TaxID=469 RepID=A0A4Q7ATV0_9GAMM|nr:MULTISPECIES: glycerol-3-phosphate 1-O-acyltransferase PlsB [Acinetobacter]MCW8039609.1 glycerol-3-phosphate 1-O-acyltransferase PlsB [Acinetobacter entericus]RZG65765.1 glycerol-3-phosphate 1-O-acyltransferase PlsB [Acinetobacter bouvetii]TCB76888.1 glycerol-3-phosphate 1-O-acyltransferase PlsB [Acinetobacter sp. ANC 4177]
MATNPYQNFYRKFTKKVLDKIVSPQVLGDTQVLENKINIDNPEQFPVCYVIQDDSTSNKVLIDNETEKRQLSSAFAPLSLGEYQEDDSFLTLEASKKNASSFYPDKLIRLVEYLLKHPENDVLLVPVTVLWGRSPENEDSWYKALMADAWTKPTGIKQALNITLYGRENYIEFHQPVSLRGLIQKALEVSPNFSPAHYVVTELNTLFNQYKEAILGPDLSDRRNVINKLMMTDAVKEAILTESIHKKISVSQAESLAKKYLDEIVSDYSYSTIRFADIALTKLWTQLYDGIEVHNFDMVRELSKDYELVYAPCHRSHIDYLLLSFVIHKRGLMVPHIAAGINLNMPIVGQIMRGAGAYFIRRSFSGNALYTAVFKEYVHSLLSRNTPLEYFIEGGRSRTGLLLPAKKGMLAMTIQSHLRGDSKPIVFIPTYFGYEKLLEGSTYIKELGGQKKQAESLFGLLKSIQKIEKVFGKVHVNFGEPVYLDDLLQQNQAPEHVTLEEELPDTVKSAVNAIAEDILENINKAVVINPVSLISLVLLNAPMHTLAERDVLLRLEQFRNYLKQNRYDERMQITELSNQEIIQYAVQLKQIEFVEHDNERWVKVCDKQDALLKYFSNNILHTFILAALTAHILKAQSENSQNLTVDDLSGQIIQAYPEVKKQFFLKWTEAELLAQINNVLEYFESERLIDLQEQRIQINDADDSLRFLSAFAHLYELNLQKD